MVSAGEICDDDCWVGVARAKGEPSAGSLARIVVCGGRIGTDRVGVTIVGLIPGGRYGQELREDTRCR